MGSWKNVEMDIWEDNLSKLNKIIKGIKEKIEEEIIKLKQEMENSLSALMIDFQKQKNFLKISK